MMASVSNGSRALSAVRPALALLAVAVLVTSASGCMRSPRFQAPFTLANPNERFPIAVTQDEAALDLSVRRGAPGLSPDQKGQLYAFLHDYKDQDAQRLLIKAPTGGANETAAMRAYNDVRVAMRRAGINPAEVSLEPYFASHDPAAPLRLSFLEFVANPPDCPDWSENLARDPQNMPWPNKGCATQRNLAVMVANPQDLVYPRGETPRPGERRDTVWGKYVKGDVTGSKWSPGEKPLPERTETSDVGGSQ